MEPIQEPRLTVSDFRGRCRVCLEDCDNMRDIFSSGVHSQLMEVTNLKIVDDDELPKNLCNDCNLQLDQCYKFQVQAKASDSYLRTLLLVEKNVHSISDNQGLLEKVEERNEPMKGDIRNEDNKCNLSENYDSSGNREEMFLLIVNEASKDSNLKNEICINYLDLEHESLELIDFCRSIIKSQLDAYHSQNLSITKHGNVNSLNAENEIRCDMNEEKLFPSITPDLNEYMETENDFSKCSQCQATFESSEHLYEHYKIVHNMENPCSTFGFMCPVCSVDVDEDDKSIFMDHLIEQKEQGYLLSDVMDELTIEVGELEVHNQNDMLKVKRHTIFKMNTDFYKCLLCENLVDSFNQKKKNHLKDCLWIAEDESINLEQHVKFTCPACSEIWIDDIENYNKHLESHKQDYVFFVKADECGEFLGLKADEFMFSSFESALEAITVERERGESDSFHNHSENREESKIYMVEDIFLCRDCDYCADSFSTLRDHYLNVHKVTVFGFSVFCPVCKESFEIDHPDDGMNYLNHLKNHKDGVTHFLIRRREGRNSYLFTDVSYFFTSKLEHAQLELMSDVCFPEIFFRGVGGSTLDTNTNNTGGVKKSRGKRRVPLKNSYYVCEKCGRKCWKESSFKKHLVSHFKEADGNVRIRDTDHPLCYICNKRFLNRWTLKQHKRLHEDEAETKKEIAGDEEQRLEKKCEICGRIFSCSSNFEIHMRQHSYMGKNLLECNLCERTFKCKSTLDKHLSAHSNPNYFECSECKFPLPSLPSLELHKAEQNKKSSTTFDCKVCKISFLTEDKLKKHKSLVGHFDNPKHLECNACQEKFATGKEFTRHIKSHPGYKMRECPLCGKRLSTDQSLVMHLGKHFKRNNILCPHCGEQFFEAPNYRRHLLTHKGVKPFPCDVDDCKKSFYTSAELTRHKRYHNNTRNFACSYCSKSFYEANHLKVHIRIHTGEKPYFCPHCDEGFSTRTLCKNHINLQHDGVGCDLIQSSISKRVTVI